MNDLETKRGIENSLKSFADKPLADAATALFESLGYKSEKRIVLKPNTRETFVATFAKEKPLNPDHALLADWQSVDFLFQLTDDEVRAAAQGNQQFLFDSKGKYNGAVAESYLFFAIALTNRPYTRTELSGITRAVNRLFQMPAMILFRHGDTLTLAVINRRLHKRDESRDVLEKVTLIKDIRFASPHRAHVEILADLSFDALRERHDFTNFVALHAAWQKSLDSSELNKRFFQEIANWYFWALDHAKFPDDAPKQNGKDHISVIRLITRLMFCWFVKEKGLVPDTLFDERKLAQTLKGFAPTKTSDKESVFYKAILQNLFFATLNTEMDKRGWTKEEQNFMAHSLYRFRESFQKPNEALDLFKNIPFLNGGLFECLDKDHGENARPRYKRIDGFSRREDSQPVVPDFLFFGAEHEVDLIAEYGDKKFKKVKVRGLIQTLNHYKFTVAENTPIEEEIALDPELSGKVFENLLAAYNPETEATVRKQTGSFYTPREIVNYMVDEALIACLKTKLESAFGVPASAGSDAQPPKGGTPNSKSAANDSPSPGGEGRGEGGLSLSTLNPQPSTESRLRHLFAYNNEPHQFTAPEVDALIAAIDSLKSLDPAVGSGAFPMGILHKLVFILAKLDPHNEKWKERQIARVRDTMATAEKIEDATARERAVRELEQQITGINEAFKHNELDYGRKLYLIENCIYGVDIQLIAVQIAKMRFFISLIVDQKIDDTQPNRGVRPLPNLETKFVAANTLIGVNRPGQQLLRNRDIDAKEASLREVRRRHFLARTLTQKRKCREQDEKLRAEIASLLKDDGWDKDTATNLASWNPYDQNASADFFDAEWMFGICVGKQVRRSTATLRGNFSALIGDELTAQTVEEDGFDVVVANPPYVRHEAIKDFKPLLKAQGYECYEGVADLFVYFYERSVKLLRTGGVLSFITPNKYYRAGYGEKLRGFLARELTLLRLIDFGDAPVFEAIAYASILAGVRAKPGPDASALAYTWETEVTFDGIAEIVAERGQQIRQNELRPAGWQLESPAVFRLLEKLRRAGKPLGEYVGGRVYYGIKTGLNDAFVVDRTTRDRLIAEHKSSTEILKPFLRGRDLKRWHIDSNDLWLCYIGWKTDIKKYPAVFEHINKFAKLLKERPEVKSGRVPWYALSRYASDYWHEYAETKIYWPGISLEVSAFCFDENQIWGNDNTQMIITKDRSVLGILNSSISRFFLRNVCDAVQNGYLRLKVNYVSQIPIPAVPPPQQKPVERLVERILAAKQKDPAADTSAMEREIDQQVYALYGLTPEEIKIVEDAAK